MSIPLSNIDCPHLQSKVFQSLASSHSIRTTNEFLLWYREKSRAKETDSNLECIQSCIIAQTARFDQRKVRGEKKIYSINHPQWTMFQDRRHVLLIYQDFHQALWNDFWNGFLIRLIENNPQLRWKYLTTNPSLFDLHYFLERSQIDRVLSDSFFFEQCYHLELFEKELNSLPEESIDVLLIDDLFSLIRPYLGLEHRLRNFLLQLTYRLNRLAQEHSLLIITGLIFSKSDVPFDAFHADEYVFLQSSAESTPQIEVRTSKSNFILNLQQWRERSSLSH